MRQNFERLGHAVRIEVTQRNAFEDIDIAIECDANTNARDLLGQLTGHDATDVCIDGQRLPHQIDTLEG